MTKTFFDDLTGAYGALYLVEGRLPTLLLVAATMLQPLPGLLGLAGGALALGVRRLLCLPAPSGNLDVMNAVFVSLLLAKTFTPSFRLFGLLVLAVVMTVLVMQMAERLLRDRAGLPVLSLPFVLVSWAMAAIAFSTGLTPQLVQPIPAAVMPIPVEHALVTFGALYLSPDWIGGTLVLLAFLLSSPILGCLGIAGYLLAELTLSVLTGSDVSPLRMLVGYNGIVTAMIVGGILAVPRSEQLLIAGLAVVVSTIVAVAATSLLSVFWLTAMSLPFIAATYLSLVVFRGPKAPAWATHWTPVPKLPEILLDRATQSEVRGIAPGSVALCVPFDGTWDVYQAFDGPYTHRGAWRYGVDFIRMYDGQSFTGSGQRLEDYICFGEAVVSPAFGTVVSFRSDIADNRPGEVNTRDNWGNYVMIAVAGGSYVVIAHLQQWSVQPGIGTFVYPGMVLGRCGNSGRSPQPHIHMHVQDVPVLGAPTRGFHLSYVLYETPNGLEFTLNHLPMEQQRLSSVIASAALRHPLRPRVGQTASYRIERRSKQDATWSTAVEIDLAGRFILKSGSNASVILHEGPHLLALDERSAHPDPLLDTMTLAIGLTPFVEEATCWRDAQPSRALPLSPFMSFLRAMVKPFGGALDSRYTRRWLQEEGVWLQLGQHSLRLGPIAIAVKHTEARICEANGLISFALFDNGTPEFTASLADVGCRADIGIPAWSVSVDPPSVSNAPISTTIGQAA